MQGHRAGDDTKIRTIRFEPKNVWRVGWVIIALIALALLLNFILDDGGSVIFTVLMAWFASIAMEPAVRRLSKHMRRGLASFLVMIAIVLFLTLFFIAFGKLFFEQIVQLVNAIPSLMDSALKWYNSSFDQNLTTQELLSKVDLTPEKITGYASNFAGGVFGLLASVLGGLFGAFTFGLFLFYLSADGPRLRLWLASLCPPRWQEVFINVWDVTAQKTGGYVAARVILAALNGGSSAIVFLIIGMPSWLALGIWTGLVAQFVPTIGTYLAIILPVIVGLLSPNPWIGVMALVWALIYQQVENLTFEPRISARAVNVHPAVAFGSVLLGAALFGVAGALLAIPVCAMMLTLLNIYRTRYQLIPTLEREREEIKSAEHDFHDEPEYGAVREGINEARQSPPADGD